MQQLREQAGLIQALWLQAATKSQQVWLEDLYLHFLELGLWSSRDALKKEPNGNSF